MAISCSMLCASSELATGADGGAAGELAAAAAAEGVRLRPGDEERLTVAVTDSSSSDSRP